ncbi:FixH family protein [Alicyclobacillus sp.]|uniref:FixH family protein n=1 Tax=Alicyclobacillus sp. TaxID=61169 RepID=UPI0025B9034B|nr:FixH family protein [Alicyclobacillus sp.]MCL6517678.1 FixH family protein [Alicyclobacillus sp.]
MTFAHREKGRPLGWVRGMLAAACVVATAGCGGAAATPPSSATSDKPLASVAMTAPRDAAVGQAVTLQVQVTRQGAPVNQLDDVLFEVWPDQTGAEHRMMHAKRTGDGLYTASYTFPKPGKYWVMYHVIDHGVMIMTAPQSVQVH